MKTFCVIVQAALAALVVLGVAVPATAQPAASAASAARPLKPAKPARPPTRLMSPAESANQAAQPGDLRPEHPVTPQIRIPLGKPATPATPAKPVARPAPVAPGAIDDAAARCEAEASDAARADCRARMARERAARKPG